MVRETCDFCLREKKWNTLIQDKVLESFTPRIRDDLQSINIRIDNRYLKQILEHGSLMIGGSGTGSGKTLFACKIMFDVMKGSFIEQLGFKKCLFVPLPDLLEKLRKSYYDEGFYPLFFEDHINADLLVLDDIGAEQVTDWVLEKIYQLVNHRYEFLLPTIFTSNLTGKELANRLGDRIVSRIEQMSMAVKLKNIDHRLHG